MPIDASIPLQVQPPQFMGPAQAMSLQNLAQQRQMQGMEMQQMQQDRQEKNALRQLLQQPGIIDPATGTINPKAYGAVMKAAPMHGQKIVQDSNATALRLSELNIQKMKQYHDWDNENILEHGAGMISQYDADLKAYGPERSGRDYEMAKHKVIDEARKSGAYPPEYVDHLERKFGPVGIENFRGIYTRLNPQADPHKDQTPFTKELIAAGYKQGTPEFNRQLQKHIDKMDAPARTTINMGGKGKAPTGYQWSKADPDKLEPIPGGPASAGGVTDEGLRFAIEQSFAGDKAAIQGLARNKEARAKLLNMIPTVAKKMGLTPKDVARQQAEFQGFIQGEKTVGTRQAQIEMAGQVLAQFIPIAKQASDEYKRSGVKSVNDLQKLIQGGTASPALRKLNASVNAVINAYGRSINPSGVGNEADKAEARKILDAAFPTGDFDAAIDQLGLEIGAELKAPAKVKAGMKDLFMGTERGDGKPDKSVPGSGWKIERVGG